MKRIVYLILALAIAVLLATCIVDVVSAAGPLADLTMEEMKLRTGLRTDGGSLSVQHVEQPHVGPVTYPTSLDWRDHMEFAPIRDQGQCGSCVAFATVGAVEAKIKLWSGGTQDLSEADVFFCGGKAWEEWMWEQHGQEWEVSCETGWFGAPAMDYLWVWGVVNEFCFPYDDWDMPCSYRCQAVTEWEFAPNEFQLRRWFWWPAGTNYRWAKHALVEGPLATEMSVHTDFFAYEDGVYVQDPEAEFVGGHMVVLIGYNDDAEIPYWIVRNSWGEDWGMDGYAYVYQEDGEDSWGPWDPPQMGTLNYIPDIGGPIDYRFSFPVILGGGGE